MIEKLKNYLSGFDGFFGKTISVDYDEFEKSDVIISPVPVAETVKKYADGGEIKQFVFCLRLKQDFGFGNNEAYHIFDELLKYMSDNFIMENALYFEVLESCYLKKSTAVYAEYEMKFRLIYTEG